MHDLSPPWVVGPVAWLATGVAAIVFIRSLLTRRGLTLGSAVSCMALAAFVVAGGVYLLAAPTGPLLTLLLAQFSAATLFILLTSLLRAIQSKVDPARDFAIRSLNEQNQLNRMLMGFLGLAFWTGLTVIFFNTRCEDLNYLPDARRCQNGEVLMGLHGPFSSVYYANYFGIMVFSPLVFAGFSALREWVRRRFVPTKEHD